MSGSEFVTLISIVFIFPRKVNSVLARLRKLGSQCINQSAWRVFSKADRWLDAVAEPHRNNYF